MRRPQATRQCGWGVSAITLRDMPWTRVPSPRAAVAAFSAFATACAGSRPVPAPAPRSVTSVTIRSDSSLPVASRPSWPSPSLEDGPLAIRVVYPKAGDAITARDSNFVFGSVGSGAATLRINGVEVPVLPNGAFLSWLAVPEGTPATYELVAARGPDTARVRHVVRPPPPRAPWADTAGLGFDPTSLQPAGWGRNVYRADEPIRVAVRGSADARVVLRLQDSTVLPLAAASRTATRSEGVLYQTDVAAGRLGARAQILLVRGRDTVRAAIGPLAVADTALPAVVQLVPGGAAGRGTTGGAPDAVADSERVVIGRNVPGGTYAWFLLPGTTVAATGRVGGAWRVRLDARQEIWVSADDVVPQPAGTPVPRRVLGNGRATSAPGWVDLAFPVGDRPPYRVEVAGRRLDLVLYGTAANADIVSLRAGTADLVRHVQVLADGSDRTRVSVELSAPVFGWQVRMQGNALVLRVRRPPAVAPDAPLKGLTIMVDPGHPPIGSTGPTGLYEPIPVRWVAERLAPLLEGRGATVLLTRTTDDPVPLELRPVLARRADAHAFVSIHLNALPDGTNPLVPRFGSGTYWFHPMSAPLAQAVQDGLVRRLGLPDEGTFFDNLAVVRNPWVPSVLTEGAHIMQPLHEAWLRLPAFQAAYAQGIVDGLEAFFRRWAAPLDER